YDGLARKGYPVAIVSSSAQEQIRRACVENDWRVSIYSEAGAPNRAEPWQSCWRPWVCILRARRIVYAQGAAEPWQSALARVSVVLASEMHTGASPKATPTPARGTL